MTQQKQEKKPKDAAPEAEKINPAAPPESDRPTIAQAKKACCDKLQKVFTSKLMNERLMKMAGGDASRVAKNLTSFLSIITQDDGGKKKVYYMECSIQSLTMCFLESMNMQLPFDSRQLVSMVIYDYEAELDISYKGFVNSLNRHYKNAFVECKLVFEGDEFTADIDGRVAKYTYKPKDPFAVVTPDFAGVRGGYCFFSYTDTDGAITSRLVFLSRTQILKNRSRARQHYVWDADPKAMAEKTCIREGSKLPFAAIDLDVDIEEVDNRHYDLEKPAGMSRLESLLKAQDEVVNGTMGNAEETKASDEKKDPAAGNKVTPAEDGKDGIQSQPDSSDEPPPPAGDDTTTPPSKGVVSGKGVTLEPKITDAQYEEINK